MSDVGNTPTPDERFVGLAHQAIAAAKDSGSTIAMCFVVLLDDVGMYRWHRVIAQHNGADDWCAVVVQSHESWPYADDAEAAMRAAVDLTYATVPGASPYISDAEIAELLDGDG